MSIILKLISVLLNNINKIFNYLYLNAFPLLYSFMNLIKALVMSSFNLVKFYEDNDLKYYIYIENIKEKIKKYLDSDT